jgi:phenylacetic acid degradation operon negative regulatory protein
MNARTEEMLYVMMWIGGQLMTPTYFSLTESFEDWAGRTGCARRITQLRQKGLIERSEVIGFSDARILRLTDEGRATAQGELADPQALWGRKWDGRWRLVLFDVPASRKALRMQLWRFLRINRFGYLQNSVWITPDATDPIRERIGLEKAQVGSLMLLQARPDGGESDEEIVREAWDFKLINQRYEQYLWVLDCRPARKAGFESLRKWALRERKAWLMAVRDDPFLPEALLPGDYAGQRAWSRRAQALNRL